VFQNRPDLKIENNSHRNISNATVNPISITGMFQSKVDCLFKTEPIMSPTMMMLKESKTMLNDNRLLIRSNLVNI